MCTKLIDAIESEELIAKQRSPITNDMFAAMEKLAKESPLDSAVSVIFDIFCLIRITGFRVAEYAQTTQGRIDIHEYPSGNQVVKAFLPTDWIFKNDKGRLIKVHSLTANANLAVPSEVKVTFRIQKNCRNGQKSQSAQIMTIQRSVNSKIYYFKFNGRPFMVTRMMLQSI